jgi:hypothetical protein
MVPGQNYQGKSVFLRSEVSNLGLTDLPDILKYRTQVQTEIKAINKSVANNTLVTSYIYHFLHSLEQLKRTP